MGKSRPLSRVGNKRLITDLLWRMRFVVWLLCMGHLVAVRGSSVAVYGSFGRVGIRIGGRGRTPFKAVL